MAPAPLSRKRPAGFDAANPAAYAAGVSPPFDALVRAAAARGRRRPRARGPRATVAIGPGVPPGTLAGFVGVLGAFGQEYALFVICGRHPLRRPLHAGGRSAPLPAVRFSSIWNEPNYGAQLAPQAVDNSTVEVSPLLYRELLDAAWTALGQTGHGADKIVIGEVAPRGETTRRSAGQLLGDGAAALHPRAVLRGRLAAPAPGTAATLRGCPATATASKAFPSQRPGLLPRDRIRHPPLSPGSGDAQCRHRDQPDYADLPKLPNLQATLDGAVAAYGSKVKLPIYDTEFRYQTNPPEKIARAISPTPHRLLHELGRVHQLERPPRASWISICSPIRPLRATSTPGSSSPTGRPRFRCTTRSGSRSTCRRPRVSRVRPSRCGAVCGRLIRDAPVQGAAGREHPVQALER